MKCRDVYEIASNRPGPTVAVFAGVHGNETAGVLALRELLPTLKPTKGKLYLVFANPPAIEQNVRMVNKNLNRCFFAGNDGSSPEDVRARELMKILDDCDALLDLHMFYDADGLPFVICEDNALDLAQKFDVDIISTNWTEVEPGGTDGYMFQAGKIGVCVECGPIGKAVEYVDFAKQTIFQFLAYFDMTGQLVDFSQKPKRLIKAERAVFKTSQNFTLQPGLKNFDRLKNSQLLAVDGAKKFTGKTNQCIIFPHYSARLGEEAYIIGQEVKT